MRTQNEEEKTNANKDGEAKPEPKQEATDSQLPDGDPMSLPPYGTEVSVSMLCRTLIACSLMCSCCLHERECVVPENL